MHKTHNFLSGVFCSTCSFIWCVLFTFLFGIIPPNIAVADLVRGRIDCRVVEQSVSVLEAGRVSKFSGLKNSFETGDSLTLFYKLTDASFIEASGRRTGHDVVLELYDGERDTEIFGYIVGAIDLSDALSKYPANDQVHLTGTLSEITMGSEFIEAFSRRSSFYLRRYKKGSWHGFYYRYDADILGVRSPGALAHIAAIDCVNIDDALENIVFQIKRLAKR